MRSVPLGSRPGRSAMSDAGYLTIGKVVKRLQDRYPDLSVSKVRFLEDEGLISPARTPGGYRLYSQHDIQRLETILHLQKTRFLPLSVIKEQLEHREDSSNSSTVPSQGSGGAQLISQDNDEMRDKLHPIDTMPEVLDVSVGFVQQLAEVGVITLSRSPHGRYLVDGHDFPLIRACDELRHYGIGPKNLRQYVQAARRESGLFDQALVPYAHKGGATVPASEETRNQFNLAFTRMLTLTDQVRDFLIRKQVRQEYKGMEPEGDTSSS